MRALVSIIGISLLFSSVAYAQDAAPTPPQADPRATPPPAVPLAGTQQPIAAPVQAPRADTDRLAAAAAGEGAPSSGLGALITGGVFAGLGVVNLATAVPVCSLQLKNNPPAKKLCTEIELGVGGGLAGVGVILLIVGGAQRSNYNDWRRANGFLEAHVEVIPLSRGAAGGFKTTF